MSLAGEPWALYDLANDRAEMNDLSTQQKGRAKEMSAQWNQWAKRTHVLRSPTERVEKE